MLLINRTLISLASGMWGWIFAIVAVRFISLISITGFSVTVTDILDSYSASAYTGASIRSAVISAALLALLMLFSQLLQGELEHRCSSKARTQMRSRIFSKVLELDVGHIERIGPVSAVTSSVDAVENMVTYYSTYLPCLIFSVIAPFYLFFRLKDTDLTVAVILLAVSLILLPVNNVFRKKIEELRVVYWASVEDMTAYYLDSIRGLTTLKLFNRSDDAAGKLEVKAEKLNRDINSFMKVNFTSFLVTEGIIYSSILICVGRAVRRCTEGSIALGSALSVLLLSYSFFSSVRQLMGATHSALTSVAAAGKVEQILGTDATRPYDPERKCGSSFDGIEMSGVSFSYEGRGQALSDVSIKIKKGSTVALAGPSGCGKSTAASLLMKFSDPDEGSISIEGTDYLALKPEELRRRIAMVPQSVYIFSGTLRENLLIADPDADDSRLLAALEDAALLDLVREHREGLDMDVGDAGARLSGGQKQKIGIARALLSDAEYLIFGQLPTCQGKWACNYPAVRTTLLSPAFVTSKLADVTSRAG